ncbi:MAG: zinc-binding dehydrogenase, partial [Planctomycetes bacterium]|nr:zinc-binding dehydrogenase [Planctomycetota bacterium]
AKTRGEDLEELNGLIEAGKLRPILDRTFPLEQIRDAHEHSEHCHPRGKIVLTI